MNEESLHIWKAIRAKITHEDSWIQVRVNWLLVSNAFLFAAYAALLAIDPSQSKVFLVATCTLLLIPILGIVLAIFVFVGVDAARDAMKAANKELSVLLPKDVEKLPELHSPDEALTSGIVASNGIILSIGAAWFIVLIATLCTKLVSFIWCV